MSDVRRSAGHLRISVPWRALVTAFLGVASTGCGATSSPTSPTTSSPPPGSSALDRTAVIDALEYWQSAVGIHYVLVESDIEPRLLIRPGTDGLAPWGGGRGGIDGTNSDNRARSGLVVFEPGGGQYCLIDERTCRYLYRHEIGHALGFFGHSDTGLMRSGTDVLTDRERRMMLALYGLPHGARVETDGRWSVVSGGASGKLDDVDAARDIIEWNMNVASSYRQPGIITRWELPVRVFLRQ